MKSLHSGLCLSSMKKIKLIRLLQQREFIMHVLKDEQRIFKWWWWLLFFKNVMNLQLIITNSVCFVVIDLNNKTYKIYGLDHQYRTCVGPASLDQTQHASIFQMTILFFNPILRLGSCILVIITNYSYCSDKHISHIIKLYLSIR